MARSAEVISHWHLLVDDFNTSALDFYSSVEAALAARQVPDIATSRIDWKEGGLLSARREYFRVARGRLTFDICAAPYGTSYFFSSWFAEQAPEFALLYGCLTMIGLPIVFVASVSTFGFFNGFFVFLLASAGAVWFLRNSIQTGALLLEETILAIPVLGPLYYRLFKPVTYYSTDTRIMFQESVHRAVVETVSELRTARGLRTLNQDESRPSMRDLLRQ
jgi:hypothetical protein